MVIEPLSEVDHEQRCPHDPGDEAHSERQLHTQARCLGLLHRGREDAVVAFLLGLPGVLHGVHGEPATAQHAQVGPAQQLVHRLERAWQQLLNTHTHTRAGAHTHTHTYTHARTYTHTRTHARARTPKHTHARTHTDAHIHVRTHTHTNTHTHTHTLSYN